MSKIIHLSIIVTTSLFFLLQAPAFAGVYKWVDTDGQVHYGAQPGNTGAEKMSIRTNETTKARVNKTDEEEGANENTGDSSGGENNNNDGAPAEIQPEIFVEEKIPTKENRRLCKQAKEDVTTINSRGRMREINDNGEYIYLSEKQRQQRISAAKKRIKKYCY